MRPLPAKAEKLCNGGYAEGGEVEDAGDTEELLNHCALECMHAIESKDTKGFIDGLHVLIADLMNKMSTDSEPEEKE